MIKFGTGGWRAIIGDDFIKSNIQLVAQGISALAKNSGKSELPIVVGYDRRFLSKEASQWIIEVLAANGLKTMRFNRSVPTPLTMYLVKKMNLHYGIEVTASHNPGAYNGIKLIVDEGRDAPLEITGELEKIISEIRNVKSISFDEIDPTDSTVMQNPFNDYLDDLMSHIDKEAIKARGLRILFDPMHGSATYPLSVALTETRCTVDMVNINKDAYFGGMNPAPDENTLKNLSEQVVAGKYDLGIATDGDGDRLGIIDSEGNYINANNILCILYYYLHEYKGWKGPVVRNVATTHLLDAIAVDLKEKCYEVPVGFKYISSKITKTDAVLGGESSGGLTVRGHINGKDAIYSAMLFVEALCKMNKTPTEIMNGFYEKYGRHEMVEKNIRFAEEKKGKICNALVENKFLPFYKDVLRISHLDGCKIYFKNGDFLIYRFSGTEPLLRIFAEAETADIAKERISIIEGFLDI